MKKVNRFPYLLPKPVVLVGALVDGKPNFLTIADICPTARRIPRFVISSNKRHYSNKGIIENETFSVNIPSYEMVAKTDYCGMESGYEVDKSKVFNVFYGEELKTAPMIKEAPITHACKLVKTVDFGDTHYLFIGEIIETFIAEKCLSVEDRPPDIKKVKPIAFYYDYWKLGERLAQSYEVGKGWDKK
jgi:flavin reductase (DIM6/NTAB) family NADH-FMN oxidoreductase RutF